VGVAAVIQLSNITKTYQTNKPFTALDGVTFDVPDGQFLSIIGKSGSGKSTLLNIIGLLDTPTTGTMHLEGIDVTDIPPAKIAKLRNRMFGFVFQEFYLEAGYTVAQNIEIPMLIAGLSQDDRNLRVKELAKRVDLTSKLKNKITELSGGEKQRVCIARALANSPKYILADEPTGNLDTCSGETVMNLFSELKTEGKTIIFVTHNNDYLRYSDRCITLSDGRIQSDEQ
jgi:putative ABC transport system ATP-binding protein